MMHVNCLLRQDHNFIHTLWSPERKLEFSTPAAVIILSRLVLSTLVICITFSELLVGFQADCREL